MAALARLAVPPGRVEALVIELNGILSQMDILARVTTDADTDIGFRAMPLSADQGPPAGLDRSPADFAPAWRDGFFLVPRLASHSGAGAERVSDDRAGADADAPLHAP
jgi:aspartyl-tRNA(Asn)/glutamyl-tRNA(Gln) amidotransferase subunit C